MKHWMLSIVLGLAFIACDDDGEVSPGEPQVPTTDAVINTDGTPGDSGAGGGVVDTGVVDRGVGGAGGSPDSAVTDSAVTDSAVSDGGAPDSEVIIDAGVDCDDPSGCYACEPRVNEQFLNRCTDSDCAAFNNQARLPLFADPLPPLP